MAAVLDKIPKLHCAVSWSGACQEHAGIFENWYQYYYPEAVENGYARIPMDWREDLKISRQWFEEIQASTPLSELRNYKGPLLAVGGEPGPAGSVFPRRGDPPYLFPSRK